MTYHILYRTTNVITGEYYVGIHSAKRLADNYLGSGIRLKESIETYGRTAFHRELISTHETRLDLQRAEMDMVTQEMLDDPLCLNMALGGGSDFERKLIEDLRKI